MCLKLFKNQTSVTENYNEDVGYKNDRVCVFSET